MAMASNSVSSTPAAGVTSMSRGFPVFWRGVLLLCLLTLAFPALAARIMEVVQMVSRPGEMADLLDYRGAKELFRPIKPFYRRKLLGLF